MKRRYKFLIAFAVLLAVLAGAAGFLLETQAGLRFVAGLAERHFGDVLTVGSVEGRLAGPLIIKNFRFRLADATIVAGRLDIDWQPMALFDGRMHFASLTASDVTIATVPSDESTNEFPLPGRIHLPLGVDIDAFRARKLDLRAGSRDLELSALSFSLHADDRQIRIGELRAHGPLLDLAGRVNVRPGGIWQTRARLAWTVRPAGYPAVSGTTGVDGSLRNEFRLRQAFSKPLVAVLNARVKNIFTSMAWNGNLEIKDVNPHVFQSNWPSVGISTVIRTSGTLHEIEAAGTARISAADVYAVHLNLAARAEPGEILVNRLILDQIGGRAHVAAKGVVRTGDAPSANVVLSWRRLRWPLPESSTPLFVSAEGEAHVSGQPDKWLARIRSRIAVGNLPAGDWTVAASGSREFVDIERADGAWFGGTISATGHLALSGTKSFRIQAAVKNLKPEMFSQRWRGTASLALEAKGALSPLRTQVVLNHVKGDVNGHRLSGAGAFAYDGKTLGIESARLSVGDDRLRISGRLNQSRNLRISWYLDAPDLSALGPDLGGSVNAEGSIEGSVEAPRIGGKLTAANLRWQSLSVTHAQSDFDIDFTGRQASRFVLHLQDIRRNALILSAIDAELEGPATAQHFSATIKSDQIQFDLAAEGSLSAEHWSGHVISADLTPAQEQAFRLEEPAEVLVGRHRLSLKNACWVGAAAARLCIDAESGSNGWNAQAVLLNLPLASLNPLLSKELALDGTLDASLRGKGGNGHLSIRAEAHSGKVDLSRTIAGEPRHLVFTRLDAKADVDDTTATARFDAALANGGTFAAEAKVPWRTSEEPAGELHLTAHLPNLSGLAALSTQVTKVAGRLDADLDLSGTARSLNAHGSARLEDGAFTLTRTGTRVQDALVVFAGTDKGLNFQATAGDGHGGRLAATGLLSKQDNGWALSSKIRGDKFRALDMPEARVVVSPDLNVDVQNYSVRLSGSVTVPSAQLKPPDFSGAVRPSPDLIVVGRQNPVIRPQWKTYTDVRVSLGDDVHFSGYGLNARIGGGININDTPDKITTASGELNILDGAYKAYGQTLTIERGRLLFSGGPVDNPGLDIRATRTTGMVVAGLQVTGTLRNPRLEVFSDPPMSQSDALAYLLFGHGVQQTSGSEKSTFNQAASALGIAGGTYLVRSVGKHVGVETVSVENASPYSTSSNQASLFLGRYLSPRVYASYGIGLYAPINLFRIRYELSRHWAIEAESGTISGADILYNIEH